MSGHDHPDAPPPELPEEFAAAYQEAFRRALESNEVGHHALGAADAGALPPQEEVATGRGGPDAAGPAPAGVVARWRASRWFLPSVVVAGGLVLVAAAYGLGAALGSSDRSGARDSAGAASSRSTPSGTAEPRPSRAPGGWKGAVAPVGIDAISADCTAPPGTDSAGHRVDYVPGNAIDDKEQTAWRCPGSAVGQTLTLRLARPTDVAQVGLVPGYAKTDPASGVDRYAENNRITRVRWTLADGVTVVQRLDPDPSSRAVQVVRVPRTTTDTVTLEILAVRRGPRDTTAISDIALASAR